MPGGPVAVGGALFAGSFTSTWDASIQLSMMGAYEERPVALEASGAIPVIPYRLGPHYRALAYEPLGQAPYHDDGQSITFVSPAELWTKDVVLQEYALGIQFGRSFRSDDERKGGVLAMLYAAQLGRSQVNRRRVQFSNLLNRAFNSSYTGGDGKELCSSSHTAVSGTRDNLMAGDLSQSTLESAYAKLTNLNDYAGNPMALVPRYLIVAPGDAILAAKLVGSPQSPSDATNALNPLSTMGIQVVVDHGSTDADAWFLLADRHDLKVIEADPISIVPPLLEGKTGNTYTSMYQRIAEHFLMFEGAVGSPGA